jgi:hypothetical protein
MAGHRFTASDRVSPDGRYRWDGAGWVPNVSTAGGSVPAPKGRGCLFWIAVLLLAALALALAPLVSPPVLIAGIALAAIVLINPGQTGDGVRHWPIWQRVPLLRTQRTAAGFGVVLLLYTVPVPGLLTAALVASALSSGTTQPVDTPTATAAASSPESGPALAVATPTAAQATPTATPAPTPTATPIAAPAAAPAAPRPPPPASTCSASVKFPSPGDGGDQTVYVSSNVPNSPVAIAVHYKTTTHPFSAVTDGSGAAAITFSIGRPTIGYPVAVDVAVGGAHCGTSFTPQ